MALELSSSSLSGLSVADKLPTTALNHLLQQTQTFFASPLSLAPPTPPAAVPSDVDAVAYKQSYAAIVALIVEAARNDASATDITSLLEDAHVSAANVRAISSVVESIKARIRQTALASIATFDAETYALRDVRYRLDYYLKSNLAEQIRQPIYVVTLVVSRTDRQTGVDVMSELTFTATLAEMTDLLSKVKDAVHQVSQRSDE